MSRCIDCVHFSSAEHIAKGFARLGLGKCAVTAMAPATFLTAGFARECPKFEAAAADVAAKRNQFLEHEGVKT